MCGKLKSAYLIAVQGNRVDAIREIADVAEKSGQSKMVEICCKFLTQYEKQRAATERRTAVQRKHGAESNRWRPTGRFGDAVTHAMGNEESFRLIVLTPSPVLENGKAKEMMEITKQLDITTKET